MAGQSTSSDAYDLQEVLELVETGFFDADEDFDKDICELINENVECAKNPAGYPCETCNKVCKSKHGLARHCTVKHHSSSQSSLMTDSGIAKKIDSLKLRVIVIECANKLSTDNCFSTGCQSIFQSFLFTQDESHDLWMKIKDVIGEFSGDAEKFYSSFYGLFMDNLIPKLQWTDTNLLLSEVANKIIVHLSGHCYDETLEFSAPSIKEKYVYKLQYLAGYVVRTLYCKVRYCKDWQNIYNQQCASVLMACKAFDGSKEQSSTFNTGS